MAMKKNSVVSGYGEHTARMTRARAAALQANGSLKPPLVKPDMKRRGSSKREASDENDGAIRRGLGFQQKKRAALKDVSNSYHDSSNNNCVNARRQQSKVPKITNVGLSKSDMNGDSKNSKLLVCSSGGRSLISDEAQDRTTEDINDVQLIIESQESIVVLSEKNSQVPQNVGCFRNGESCATAFSVEYSGREELIDHSVNVKNNLSEGFRSLICLEYMNIDSDHSNPQMCSLYAPEIYTNLRAAELASTHCFHTWFTMKDSSAVSRHQHPANTFHKQPREQHIHLKLRCS